MNPTEPTRRVPIGPANGDATLHDRFIKLWRRCLTPGAMSDTCSVWDAVQGHYAQSHRTYHNEQHLVACLEHLDMAGGDAVRRDRVEMAIWFHDVIYEPGKLDNEARSAALFHHLADEVMKRDFVNNVVDLILVTTHQTPPTDRTQQLICDIDLSSFGYPWERFLVDSTNLRAEFRGAEHDYYLGKRRFLEALLQRPKIFMSDFFFDRYERQARDNIKRFLALIGNDE